MHRVAIVAIVLLMLLAVGAQAQKAVTFQSSDTVVDGIDLRRTADGGVSVTVYATNRPAGSDVAIQRQRTCEVNQLTSAQRTALNAVRAAALVCWNTGEGL